jgi:formylglycine-generating enzyme required for sulfatase activity
MQDDSHRPLRVFWSYSHKDEALRDELHEHLSSLRRAALIADWHDRKIGAGKVWKDEIDRHLGDADVVLLLVSASFIASEYCWGEEMEKALARHAQDQARVIPVILRPCDWEDTPIARLQAVPKDARPITQYTDRDLAYVEISKAIRRAVTELKELREARQRAPKVVHSGADLGAALTSQEPVRQPAPPQPDEPKSASAAAGPASAEATPTPRDGVFIGVDPRTLPDLAVFKDVDAPWCPEMVVLPKGEFLMGSPESEKGRFDDEGPQHRVTIGYRFALGKYAVTFAEYDHFCELTDREMAWDEGWGRGRKPVIYVSWLDATAYCEWLARETGQPYRLPSEAEWEYTCRAGTTTPFSFGPTITPDQVNYNHSGETVLVGTLPPNPWGLHEMHGNVEEWVEDQWSQYIDAPTDGSAWNDRSGKKLFDMLPPVSLRMLRGGSWLQEPSRCRSAARDRGNPALSDKGLILPLGILGFRVARTLE